MLDTDTKRRIDIYRNVLVGKVLDPKSQVEQGAKKSQVDDSIMDNIVL